MAYHLANFLRTLARLSTSLHEWLSRTGGRFMYHPRYDAFRRAKAIAYRTCPFCSGSQPLEADSDDRIVL